MPRIADTTDRQSSFLRAFRHHPAGPPPEAWPSPAILRRWLRHDGFRRAFRDLRRTLKTMLEFQSLTTGLAAARALHESLTKPTPAAAAEPDTDVDTPTAAPSSAAPSSAAPSSAAPSSAAPSSADAAPSALNPEPQTLNPPQPDPATARAELQRERLRHRAALTFLRLAHARLTKPARRATLRPPPPPAPLAPDDKPLTREDALRRLVHPNCRPEVAHAFITGGPHPFYDEPEYDMTVRPHRLIVRTPSPRPPAAPTASASAGASPGSGNHCV